MVDRRTAGWCRDRSVYRAGRLAPTFEQAGVYAVQITVSDGQLARSEDLTLQVNDVNRTPQFVPLPPLLGQEGVPLSFTITAADADGQELSYSVVGDLPRGARFSPSLRRFEWTPGFDQAGDYLLRFAARDGAGLSDTTMVAVKVLNVNQPPTVDSLSDHVVLLGQTLQLRIPAADPDPGTALNYSATLLPPGATLDATTGDLMWQPLAAHLGSHPVRVVVSDGESAAATTFTLVVSRAAVEPHVRIEITPSFATLPGQKVWIQPVAEGIADIASLQLTINGQLQTLDRWGRAVFVPSAGTIHGSSHRDRPRWIRRHGSTGDQSTRSRRSGSSECRVAACRGQHDRPRCVGHRGFRQRLES